MEVITHVALYVNNGTPNDFTFFRSDVKKLRFKKLSNGALAK